MKKFRFRLAAALSLRSFGKNQAALELAGASSLRIENEQRMDAKRAELQLQGGACLPARGQTISGPEMVRRQSSLAYLRSELEQLQAEHERLLTEEAACRRALMQARQQEQSLLRLKEKGIEAHRLELERADELAVMEFVNARHRSEPV